MQTIYQFFFICVQNFLLFVCLCQKIFVPLQPQTQVILNSFDMKKLLLTSILSLLALLVSAHNFRAGEFYYRTISAETGSVELIAPLDDGGNYDQMQTVQIPSQVEYEGATYTVRGIDSYVFALHKNLKSVSLPATLKNIADNAFFGCSQLEQIRFPEGLETIGAHAFDGDSLLQSVTIPESVTTVDANAFQNCTALRSVVWNAIDCAVPPQPIFYNDTIITSFRFGNKVKRVPTAICHEMRRLESIVLPPSVTVIDDYAFIRCTRLKNITLPNGLVEIGAYAFNECYELAQITLPNSLQRVGNRAFDGNHALRSITVPEGVTFMDSNAFQNCTALRSVVWNAVRCSTSLSDKGIPYPVFFNDSNITSFRFGNKVQTIPAGLCYALRMETVVLPASLSKIEQFGFANCTRLKSITLPDAVEEIGDYAFNECTQLTQFIVPKNVKTMGNHVFRYCTGLKAVVWNAESATMQAEDPKTFENDTNITSFKFGNTVQTIPQHLCFSLRKVKEIRLPESLVSIGEAAFFGCDGLSELTIPENVRTIGWSAFGSCDSLRVLNWNTNQFELPEKRTGRGEHYLFAYRSGIRSIVFGPNVYSVPARLGEHLNRLESVTLPDDLQRIEERAFYHCNNLKSVVLPKGLKFIDKEAFAGTGVSEVEIPESLTEIGAKAFGATYIRTVWWNAVNCRYIEDEANEDDEGTVFGGGWDDYESAWGITEETDELIPNLRFFTGEQVRALPDRLYAYTTFSQIELADGIEDMYTTTFSDCTFPSALYNARIFLYMPRDYTGAYSLAEGTKYIADEAFKGCKGLTEIRLPESLVSIGDYAFSETAIRSIHIPQNVENIGFAAFLDCPQMERITVDERNTVFDSRDNCNALMYSSAHALMTGCRNTVIPESTHIIGRAAFAYCEGLTEIQLPAGVAYIDDFAFFLSSLTSISIGENVYYIGAGALSGCPNLTRIQIDKNNKHFTSGSKHNMAVSIADSVLIAMTAKASIPRSVHTVGAYAGFNSPIQSLVVPKHVVEIQENAFGNCRQLQKVQLGKGLKTIGKYAFNRCSKIDKLFIPASVETIDYGAFTDCEGLRTCTFEDDISISTSWFVGCHDLVIKSGKSRIQYN